MKAEIARTMQRDLSLFLPVTVGIMAVLLVVGVGSLRTAAILLSSILLAVIWMLGAMGWAGDSLTALSNTAPTILLALGTAYFMHLAASYQKELGSGGSHEQVVMRALQRVRRPTVVAGVTTAIGFGSLATSSIPLVRGFGIDLAAGIIAVVIIACTTVPSALVLFSPGPGAGVLAGGRRLGVWLFRITQLDARAPRVIVGASLVLLVGAAVAALRLDVDSSGPNAFPADSPFRISSDFYRDHISGDVIENVYLTVPEEGALKNPEKLKAMLAFQAAAEALPEIDNSVSIANYIALMNRALEGDELSEERIPASREAVAQYLLLYSLSGDLTKFDDLVDESYTNARIILNASVPSSAASARLRKRLTGLAQDHFGADAGRPPVLSTEILLSQAADALATEQVRSFATALLLIIAIVTVAFRSLTAGARLLLPNSLPIALGFGVMSLLGLTLSESTALIAVVALGIAVDGTVHLLSAIRDSERAHGSRPAAVAHGMQTAGRPVIVTGLIVVIGFSVLLLSEFRLVSELGGLTALTIFYCVVADLVVLPAQLLSRWRISGDADTRLSARGRGPGAALIQIDGSTGTARLVSEANGEASFELLEPHCDWHDCGGTKMTVNWLADVPLERGRVIRVDGSAPMMLSVQWAGSERQRHGVEDSVK
jgi:predicted RND superfamily exporter protein